MTIFLHYGLSVTVGLMLVVIVTSLENLSTTDDHHG